MPEISEVLRELRERLSPLSETANLDAQVLLAHALEKPRAWVLAHFEEPLAPDQALALQMALRRLEAGQPLPYVLGEWEFYGLNLEVTPDTLIPRPETELLVEEACAWLRAHPGRRRALDVGAGSGCIAIALATCIEDLMVIASDISLAALEVAQRNIQRHGLAQRVRCVRSDLLPAGEAPFDMICANLPYVPTKKLQTLRVAQHEPRLSLDGGEDGLDVIRRLLLAAPTPTNALSPGGILLLEIDASQGGAACALAREAFPGATVERLADLAGRDRLVKVLAI